MIVPGQVAQDSAKNQPEQLKTLYQQVAQRRQVQRNNAKYPLPPLRRFFLHDKCVQVRRSAIFQGQARSNERSLLNMGMFDGLLGGIVGAGMVSVVNNVLEQHGGVQGVVNQFEKNGLGPTVRSWVSTGPNQSISPEDVHRTLGPELLQQLSQKSGLSVEELTEKLAHVLPQAVDKLTPDGAIPKG